MGKISIAESNLSFRILFVSESQQPPVPRILKLHLKKEIGTERAIQTLNEALQTWGLFN